MSETTTALTAEQVADFHDVIDAHDDDLLQWVQNPLGRLRRRLPRCPACDASTDKIVMQLQGQADGLIILTFDACGHAFHTDRDVMAAGLRIYKSRQQA